VIGTYIIVALVAYLLGSIPFGYILLRLFRGQDVRATGSGNIGATNVARSAPGLGLLTLLLDAGKGFVAVSVVARVVFPRVLVGHTGNDYIDLRLTAEALAAMAAIVGHVFPVWLGFRGGKGVATAVGAFVVFAPIPILGALAVFVVVVGLSRYVSLGSILAAVTFPVFTYAFFRGTYPSTALEFVVAGSLLIIVRHQENIRRLFSGTEHRFSLKGKSA